MTLLFVACLASVTVKAQDKAPAKTTDAPVITFVEETHDFGEMTQGDKVSYDFTFKNTGKTDLVITNVSVTCGCTTPYWPKEPIKPGQTSKITAAFNSAGKSGPFSKPITIASNATDPAAKIFIKGKINVPTPNDGVPERKPSMLSDQH